MEIIPNPGTEQAIKLGCTCPVLDNNYGEGAYIDSKGKRIFWYDCDCPLHGGILDDTFGKTEPTP